MPRPPSVHFFPYTTLFRSNLAHNQRSDSGPDFKQDYAARLHGPIVTSMRRYMHRALQEYKRGYIAFPEVTEPTGREGNVSMRFMVRDNTQCRTDLEDGYVERGRNPGHSLIQARPSILH